MPAANQPAQLEMHFMSSLQGHCKLAGLQGWAHSKDKPLCMGQLAAYLIKAWCVCTRGPRAFSQ